MAWPLLCVSGVWLVVLYFQLRCFAEVSRFCGREEANFRLLCDGKGDPASGRWVDWVSKSFGADECGEVFSRDDALAELDYWLSRLKSLLWLQRLAVLSPIIGVLITSIGLLTFRPTVSSDATLSTILESVSPLFGGILGGALMAILCQVLLVHAGRRIDTVREAARDWFDRHIWRPHLSKVREATAGLPPVLRELTTTIRDSAVAYANNVRDLHQTSVSLKDAADFSRRSFKELFTGLKSFTDQVKAFEAASTAVRGLMASLESSLPKTIENVKTASEAFSKAVTSDFAPAAHRHHAAALTMGDATTTMDGMLRTLDSSGRELISACGTINESAKSQQAATELVTSAVKTASKEVSQSIREDFHPANRKIKLAAEKFSKTIDDTFGTLEKSAVGFTGGLNDVKTVIDDMTEAAAAFRRFADLQPEVESLKCTLREMNSIVDAFRKLGDMTTPLKEIQISLERAATSSEAVEELPARFKVKVEELTSELLQRQMGDLEHVLRDIIFQMMHAGRFDGPA